VDQKGPNKAIIVWLEDLKDGEKVLTKAWKKKKGKSSVKEIRYYFFLISCQTPHWKGKPLFQ